MSFRTMAPSNRKDHVVASEVKQDIFKFVQFKAEFPDSFVALKNLERDYGLSLQVKMKKINLLYWVNSLSRIWKALGCLLKIVAAWSRGRSRGRMVFFSPLTLWII